jgi:superfamily II DNA or RNA helicase
MHAEPYSWQIPHIERLIECLTEYPYALDASDTGTGKTFTSLFMCRELEIKPFIIAPKIVITAWHEAANAVGVELLDVVNIERLKGKNHDALHRLPNSGTKKHPIANWKWNLPPGTFIIWDEVQTAGGQDTQNARALYALRQAKLPCLALSATVADDPMRLKSLGYLLGLHQYDNFRSWCIRHGCVRNPFAGGYALMFSRSGPKAEAAMRSIHEGIFPTKGSRLRIDEIDEFPDCATFAEAFDLPDHRKVEQIYDELEESLIEADDDEPQIVKRLRARQNVELLKTPLFVELTLEALEEEKSVVVFVNFRETLEQIKLALAKKGVEAGWIMGGQAQGVRDAWIQAFQTNQVHVMLVMIQAGGLALSLHDLHGRPREAFLAPPDSAKDLKQALGRIHRAGSLSKAIQKIVFVARTVEETACENVRRKLNNLSTLNDGDLSTGAGF